VTKRSLAEETPCKAEGCDALCLGRTCSSTCRSKLWKAETGYKDRRSVRNARQRRSEASPTRYAIVQTRGSIIEVLGFDVGKSKRAIERAFGIRDRDDLAAIAERHLPGVV
jgi:hypothetical protein